METTEGLTIEELLTQFDKAIKNLKIKRTKKNTTTFWDRLLDLSLSDLTEEECLSIESQLQVLPDVVFENGAIDLRGEVVDIEFEFVLFFWGTSSMLGAKKVIFLDGFLKKYANEKLTVLLYSAYKSYEEEDIESTVIKLNELLQQKDDLWVPRYLLAEIYKAKGSYQNAIIQANLMIDILAKQYLIFKADSNLSELSEVYWWYEIDMRLIIGNCYEVLKDYNAAAKSYEYLIKKGVSVANLYGGCAFLNNKIGNYRKAIKYAQKEIDLSNAEYAHWNKIEGLRKLHKKKEALAALEVVATFSRKKKSIANERLQINKLKPTAQETEKETTPPKIKTKYLPLKKMGKKLEREDILENLLYLRIASGVKTFGRAMTIFKNKNYFGKQLFAGSAGILDLLLEDKKENTIWVVELKRDHDYNDAFEQTHRYMDWVKKSIAKRGQKVKGIICLYQPSDLLLQQVKKDPEIELHTYEFSFKQMA